MAAALSAQAQTAPIAARDPVIDPAEDARRLAFARSLLGAGKKVVRRTVAIRNSPVEYDTTLGAIEINDEEGRPLAVFVYTAYTRVAEGAGRPLTFAWGGGPSVPSTSFHFSSLGPRLRQGESAQFTDNAASILDRSDLVFVDPVGTGWSMPARGRDYGEFYSVANDACAVTAFIQTYRAENRRSSSPLYLAGRSYGTLRLASVAYYLKQADVGLAGLLPVAAAMDGNAFWESSGNMASYYLMVPNYAAIAWHHDRQWSRASSAEAALEEAADFALGEYLTALMSWQDLSPGRRRRVLSRLHALTGIDAQVWQANRLRLNGRLFASELLKHENKILQSSDARIARARAPAADAPEAAAVESFVNVYVREELGVEQVPPYREIAPGLRDGLSPRIWTVDRRALYELGSFKMHCMPNYLDDIAEAMIANPTLRVQQHSGIYDLQSTSFPGNWSLRNMNIPDALRANVSMYDYAAGHAIYDSQPTFDGFMQNVAAFYAS